MGDGTGIDEDLVVKIVRAALRDHREPDQIEESNLSPGRPLTLSLFSELLYALGTPTPTNAPPKQRLPVEITTDGYLVFEHAPPAWATDMIIVRRGEPDESVPLPDCNPPRPIPVDCADAVIAVKLLAKDEVRLVSFVTHTRLKASHGNSRRPKPPAKGTVQAPTAQAAPAQTQMTP